MEGLSMNQEEGRVAWLCQVARNTLAALLDTVENWPLPAQPDQREKGLGRGFILKTSSCPFCSSREEAHRAARQAM